MFCKFFSDNIVVKLLFTLLVLCYALANDKNIELLSLYISLFLSLSADLLRHPAPDALYIFRSWSSVEVCSSDRNILEHFTIPPRLSLLGRHLTCYQSTRFQNLSLDLQFRTGYHNCCPVRTSNTPGWWV